MKVLVIDIGGTNIKIWCPNQKQRFKVRSGADLAPEDLVKSVKKTNKVIVIEEGWSQSGVGSEVISVIVENAFDYLDAEPLRFSGEDIPLPYAENLEKLALPSAEVIVKKCLEIC